MKCRGCGNDTHDILVKGVGWMHTVCEVQRLNGLIDDLRAALAAREEELKRERSTKYCLVCIPTLNALAEREKECERLKSGLRILINALPKKYRYIVRNILGEQALEEKL